MKLFQEMCFDNELENLKEFFYKCGLPEKMPNNKSAESKTLEKIEEFVYENCEDLIPVRLRNLLKTLDKMQNSNEYDNFKEDLLKSIRLNVKMKYLFSKTLKENAYVNTNEEIKRLIEEINELDQEGEVFNSESSRSYLKLIDNHINKFFKLKELTEDKTCDNGGQQKCTHARIPSIAKNFFIYAGINYTKFHKKWNSNSLNDYNDLKNYMNTFKNLVAEYSDNKDIELFLFEKTYNIQLVEDIIKNTQDIIEDDLKKVYKHLSLASLLPNVNVRRKCIEILTKNKRLVVRNEDENGNGYGSSNFDYNGELNVWIEIIDCIIVQMALVTIPIMELYLYYLVYQEAKVITELESSCCISLRDFQVSEDFNTNIDNYNLICSQIRGIYKIYDDEKFSYAFDEIHNDMKEACDEEKDNYLKIIENLPESKASKMIDEYLEAFEMKLKC